MLRKLLLLAALLILVAIGLVWAGIVDWDGNTQSPTVTINPVEVGTEPRQVQTPTLRVNDGSGQAQPAPQTQPQAAPQPTPQTTPPPAGNAQ
jgi:hypothetical protein